MMKIDFGDTLQDRNTFGALYVALTTGPPVQDRQGLRLYMHLVQKLDAVSEDRSSRSADGKEVKERRLLPGAQTVELDDDEAAFVVASLDDLLRRCPREWLGVVLSAYQRLGADPDQEGKE